MNYKNLAQILINSGFRIYGLGHFDLTKDETAEVIRILLKKEDLLSYYEQLEQKRMG